MDDVSIDIPEGAIYGLLGPNGAGKTSLIRIITQITGPDSGKLFFKGVPLIPSDMNRIGYLPEERGLYKKMKVGEQAVYLARLKGINKNDAIKRLKPGLKIRDRSLVGQKGRRIVKRYGPKSSVYHDRSARTGNVDFRRAVQWI